MLNRKYFIAVVIILASANFAMAQNIEDKLLRLLEKNDIEEIKANLAAIKNKFPNQPIPYYVEAFMERDAGRALELYQNFIFRFPYSDYTQSAKLKICQYYYAKNSFDLALNAADEFLNSYSNSEYADDAHYLKIRCLTSQRNFDLAKSEIKTFVRKFPDSMFKIFLATDLRQFINFENFHDDHAESGQEKADSNSKNFTLQVGAFRDSENAKKQLEQLSQWGYPVQIATKNVNDEMYYVVWIGNFQNEDDALNFGDFLKRKYNLSFQIIRM